MPKTFAVARLLGLSYALRCVVFHNVSEQDTPFTRGMRVTISPAELEEKLQFIVKHYKPVRLEHVLACGKGQGLPERSILVTFDDAYASVLDFAAPLCSRYDVPAVFFVNAAFLDNQRLATDNLVCYVANKFGMQAVAAGVRSVMGCDYRGPNSVSEVFQELLPTITLVQREALFQALIHITGLDERRLANQAGLYMSRKGVAELARFGINVGNHTYTHVHCRSLTSDDMVGEISRNQQELEALSGQPVRAFSVPYGSSIDLTDEVAEHLRHSGHDAVFLSEGVANFQQRDRFHLDRVSPERHSDRAFFCEMEILPRLRSIRNRYVRRSRFPSS